MKDVTVAVKERRVRYVDEALEVKDLGGRTGTIRIREYQPVVLEGSTGVFYTSLSYPKYGTQEVDGETVVAQTDDEEQTVVAAAMLNLIPRFGFKKLVYPIVQVGIGTGKERPSLAVGTGMRFTAPADLALTGGAIWTWVRDLKELSVGDPVGGTAAIEDDLELRFESTPRFYLGIQYNF